MGSHIVTVVLLAWVAVIFLGLAAVFFLLGAVGGHYPEDRRSALAIGGASASMAVIFLLVSYAILQCGLQQDTSVVRGAEGEAQQPKESDQAPKPAPKPEEPITVERTTCLVKEVETSEPRMTTAETAELRVTVAVPSNARECRDTVAIDAPTFGLGKEATQRVSVVRPKENHVARWLLDPEKPGSWNIAVETKRDRELVSVAVTTPLGFPAAWVQAGAFLAGAATLIFGVLALIYRRG